MSSPSDRLLAETAVEWGLLTSEAAEACLRLQSRYQAKGREVPLEQILLKKRLLGTRALEKLLRYVLTRAEQPEFERYEVESTLGEGGMAVVFRARDRQLGRRVALKVLRDSGDPDRRARFVREARAIARLRHPHVVSVFDAGEDAGRMFLVMELVGGRNLHEILAEGSVPLERRLAWIEQVARAVHHAHEQGIVHRDLKPANILISEAGEAKVADFGLARWAGDESGLTQTGAAVGTPVYMAPEQVEGRGQDVGPATDVFALGAILYEAITGRWPHPGRTASEIYSRISRRSPVPPRRIRPRLAPDLEVVALRALEKEPSRRYATALDLAEDLRRHLEGRRILARPAGPAARVARWVLRRRQVVLPVAAVVVLAGALGSWLVAGSVRRSGRIEAGLAAAARDEEAGELASARDSYRLVLELDPTSREARAGLARTERGLAEAEARRESFRVEAERRAEVRAEATRLVEAARPALVAAERALYVAGADLVEVLGRLGEAETLLERAVGLDPEFPLGHYMIGRAREYRGRYPEAEASFRRSLELEASFAPARFHLGRVLVLRAFLLNIGHDADAMAVRAQQAAVLAQEAEFQFKTATAAGALDDEIQPHVARGMIAFCRRDYAEMSRIARRGIDRFGDREGVEALHWIAGIAARDDEDSLRCYDAALAIRPNDPVALFSRSWILLRVDLKRALADLDRLLRVQPRFVDALNNRGWCRRILGDLAGARADYDAALAIEPDDRIARYNRALAREDAGDRDGALADLERVLARDPEFAPALLNRGSLRRKRGDLAGGMADIDASIRVRPDYAEAYAMRGVIRLQSGDAVGAIEDFESALRHGGDNPLLAESVSALLEEARRKRAGR